jgi:hypothetical protein
MRQQSVIQTLDSLIARMLWVNPQPTQQLSVSDPNEVTPAERALSFSLIFSATRCILQYIVLPFLLPILGIVGNFSIALVSLIDVIALGSIFLSLRRFWASQHPRRWEYLIFAMIMIFVICIFLTSDLRLFFKS